MHEESDLSNNTITSNINNTDSKGNQKNAKPDIERHGWNKIGVHRPIASFWYQFVLLLIIAVPALLMYGFIIPNYILPYPDALGYQSLTVSYFGLFFSIMDLATQPACERFVAQYAEINPRKALKYIQFFIYFQMFTGLIQITVVSVYCFTYLIHTDLNYATWFFLLYSTTQFPGMLGAYNSTLKGYQRYDRSNIVEMIQGALFENITQVIFVLIGRWWGSMNPDVGELMGATMGYIIGKYIDDFFAMGLSAYFVSKIMEPYGISLKETLIPSFTMTEVKESLTFGIKLLGASLISTLTDYLTLLMMIEWLPNYISIIAYVEIARTVAGIVNTRYNFSALLSESYNNGKKKLTQYGITRYISHWWYLAFFLTLEISIMVPPVLEYLGGDYGKAAWIIPIYVFPRLLVNPPSMGAAILQACDKPIYRTYGIISEKVTKMLTVFILLSPWVIRAAFPNLNLIVMYVLHDIPAYIVITLTEFWFIHSKVAPLKINWWQTFVAGTLASIPIIPINYLMLKILDIVWENSESLLVPVILIGVYFLMMLFIFPHFLFFFYGLLGGWDDAGLEEFHRAVDLCGPSKFVVKNYYRWSKKGHEISPLKNRFATPHEEAYREIDELTELMKNEISNQ